MSSAPLNPTTIPLGLDRASKLHSSPSTSMHATTAKAAVDECEAKEQDSHTELKVQNLSIDCAAKEAMDSLDRAFSLMADSRSKLPLSKLETAIALFRQILDKIPATHPLHSHAASQVAYALTVKFMHTSQMASLLESLKLYLRIPQTFFKGVIGSDIADATSHKDDGIQSMAETAEATLANYVQSTSLDSINSIASLLQTSLTNLPAGMHPKRARALSTLAAALCFLFHHSHSISDLDNAISHLKEALKDCTERNTERSNIVYQLCAVLMIRLHFGGQVPDLMEAGALFKQEHIHDSGASTPMKSARELLAQASKLQEQFWNSGSMGDLDQAIVLYRQARSGMPPSFIKLQIYQLALNNLANALMARFRLGGQHCDLEEAILLHRRTLELRPLPHPQHADSLCNLANALMTQFEQSGQKDNIDEAISLYRQGLELRSSPHPKRPTFLNSLANALQTRYEQNDQLIDDNIEAISLYRQALELVRLPPPHTGYTDPSIAATTLSNLSNSLLVHFNQMGRQEDLDDAVSMSRRALELRPAHHPNRPDCIGNCAVALITLFQQTGERLNLDEAISLYRDGLELLPSPHPRRSRFLSSLSDALMVRFEQSGYRDRADLDEAIVINREALGLQSRQHPHRSDSVNNLANALWSRYIEDIQGGTQDDLEEAELLYREAIELSPSPHPDRTLLSNLANTLAAKFLHTTQREALDEAIALYREALELGHPPLPDRSYTLNNLSNALESRFTKLDHKPSDLDEAILLQRQAVELLPSVHYLRSRSLETLGSMYIRAHSHSGDPRHIEEAMLAYSSAFESPSQNASATFRIATAWSAHADRHRHPTTIKAYDAALQSLSQIASLELDIQARQEILRSDSDGLARRAALFAIQENKLEKAIEYLEGGRAVFWSRVMHLRSPLDKLRHKSRELAEKLQNIASELERGSYRNPNKAMLGLTNRSKLRVEQEATRYRRLDEEWTKVVDEVRKLKGFEDFLLPRSFKDLQPAAAQSPVVFLIPNDKGSDCLVMTSKLTHHIPLSDLPTNELRRLVYLIRLASSQSTVTRTSIADLAFAPEMMEDLEQSLFPSDDRASKRGGSSVPSDEVFRDVLNILWKKVVKPVLNFLRLQRTKTPPILQWCPTGLFAFLPIHAAGCYDSNLGPLECASDYIVSSYVPIAGVLLESRDVNKERQSEPFKMMVVVDSSLSYAETEVEKIKEQVPTECLSQLGISGAPALVDTVYSGLQSASIVHFACHGSQDETNPLDSALLMHGREKLKISKIMQQPLPYGSLAVLCACETSKGDAKIPDEALSLGASLLFSGFRNVVATMWKMRDSDGPTIAGALYKELFRGPDGRPTDRPDISKSPQALHNAVQELRSGNVEFRRWVPFIHMGK